MAILDIIIEGDPRLRQKANKIKRVDPAIRRLAADMYETMIEAPGVGLAAPQVGHSLRLLVYDAGEGLKALINPEITRKKGEQYEPEDGCLSIPGLRGVVRRANEIVVQAQDASGKPIRLRDREFEARVIQHEVDHLNGVLFINLADPATLHMEARDSADAPGAPAE